MNTSYDDDTNPQYTQSTEEVRPNFAKTIHYPSHYRCMMEKNGGQPIRHTPVMYPSNYSAPRSHNIDCPCASGSAKTPPRTGYLSRGASMAPMPSQHHCPCMHDDVTAEIKDQLCSISERFVGTSLRSGCAAYPNFPSIVVESSHQQSVTMAKSRAPAKIAGHPDEEYFSLSSASEDENTKCCCKKKSSKKSNSVYKSVDDGSKSSNQSHQCPMAMQMPKPMPMPMPRTMPNEDASGAKRARNLAILQLLHQIVHLINQDERLEDCSGGSCPANASAQSESVGSSKIRNLSYGSEEQGTDDAGPFNSSAKIKFTTSEKEPTGGTASDECPCDVRQILASPMQQALQSIPCTVFISPNGQYCFVLPCGHSTLAMPSPVPYNVSNTADESYFSEGRTDETDNCDGNICTMSTGPTEESALSKGAEAEQEAEAECTEDSATCNMKSEPLPDMMAIGKCPCMMEEMKPLIRVKSDLFEEKTDCRGGTSCFEEDNFLEQTERTTQSEYDDGEEECVAYLHPDIECTCCHCRAMRDAGTDVCTVIATPQQAIEKDTTAEMKYFIDSIIMDLNAMQHARRHKQASQDLDPKLSLCPRQSFPVTITEVSDLGTASLFVKWVIHDCYGIGGYEIYVNGYLTNRYFSSNHDAAVICDIDVTKAHKVSLVAMPKDEKSSLDDVCGGYGKSLQRKADANKKKKISTKCLDPKPVVWTPSVYLYDPRQQTESPIRITRCSC